MQFMILLAKIIPQRWIFRPCLSLFPSRQPNSSFFLPDDIRIKLGIPMNVAKFFENFFFSFSRPLVGNPTNPSLDESFGAVIDVPFASSSLRLSWLDLSTVAFMVSSIPPNRRRDERKVFRIVRRDTGVVMRSFYPLP